MGLARSIILVGWLKGSLKNEVWCSSFRACIVNADFITFR